MLPAHFLQLGSPSICMVFLGGVRLLLSCCCSLFFAISPPCWWKLRFYRFSSFQFPQFDTDARSYRERKKRKGEIDLRCGDRLMMGPLLLLLLFHLWGETWANALVSGSPLFSPPRRQSAAEMPLYTTALLHPMQCTC